MNDLTTLVKYEEMEMLAVSLAAFTHHKSWYIYNEIRIATPSRNKSIQADFTLQGRRQSSWLPVSLWWEYWCSFAAFANKRSCRWPSSPVWSPKSARCRSGQNGAPAQKHASIGHLLKALVWGHGSSESFLLAVRRSVQNLRKKNPVCLKEMQLFPVPRE